MKPRVLGLVPARGGSKAIPQKNLAMLAGKPLIAHTIRAAQDADSVTDLVVSTDSPHIARIVKEHGARAPFLRPSELAEDTTPTAPVLEHALHWLEVHEGRTYDWVVLLQATAPLRTSKDIDDAVEQLLAEPGWHSLTSLVKVEEPHPQKMKVIIEGEVRPFMNPKGANVGVRRQDCTTVYALNGALYVFRPQDLRATGQILRSPVLPYVMPAERSVNIDTPLDLAVTEILLTAQNGDLRAPR